jgi:hypothetical protein
LFEIQLIMFLFDRARQVADEVRANPDRGDVAEKVILVGVFVTLAIAVGVIIWNAVDKHAGKIGAQITGASG